MKLKHWSLMLCLWLATCILTRWTSVVAGDQPLPITAENMRTLREVTAKFDDLYRSGIIYDAKLELLLTSFLPGRKAQRISPDEFLPLPDLPASAIIQGIMIEPNKMILLVHHKELLQLWNAKDGTKTTLANDVKDRQINSEISSDGTLVAFTSLKRCGDECIENDAQSKKVFVWNILTEALFTIDIPELVIWSTFNDRNDLILGIGDHQKLQIWEAPTFSTKQDIFVQHLFFSGALEPVGFAPTTDWLAFSARDNVHIYQLATQTEQILDLDASQQEDFPQIVFSPNGQILGIVENKVDYALLYIAKLDANQWTYINQTPLELDVEAVGSMAFSPDNRLVAIGSFTGQLLIFDLETMNSYSITIADDTPVWDIAFTEDQTYLTLWSGYDGGISVWGIDEKK
jgi:WD40 repeat protein